MAANKKPFRSASVERRDFLRVGAMGLLGLSLEDLLRARARAQAIGETVEETACILVWLNGGPSHIDTYDLKPDAPAEYRGPFQPIRTRVPGMDICELMPRHAHLADKFSLIRSVTHQFSAHAGGVQQVLTGRPPREREKEMPDYPDIGSIFKKVRSPIRHGLPQYVTMPFRFESGGPAYLGRGYEPLALSGNPNAERFEVPNLTLSTATAANLGERRELLTHFDNLRRDAGTSGSLDAMDQYRQEAWELLTGDKARRAFDLSREDRRLRDRYGRTRVGQSLCMARRLVEAGVGFVSVQAGSFDTPNGNANWDDHAVAWNIFDQMNMRLPVYDQALTALIEDIYARGLDRRVLVLALGEFGRTPRINRTAAGRPGREHHPGAMSILVAGGGMRMGQVIGATDARGERPRSRSLQVVDFLATVYQFLGIDPRHEFPDFTGRPLAILPGGEPISELVG